MDVIRSGFAYTLNRPSRTKPQSVIPVSLANSTARLDGAPTAAKIGTPAIAAFCTNSKLARPLTKRSESANGQRPIANCEPSTLSTALCRPTSSRTAMSSSARVNNAAAWMPPVFAKSGWAKRTRSGNECNDDVEMAHSAIAIGSIVPITASIDRLPHAPQLEVV